jgi:hypothetical protein
MPFFLRFREATNDNAKDLYVVEMVALNFKEWKNKQVKDEYTIECHRHIHFLLSIQAQRNLIMQPEIKDVGVFGRLRNSEHEDSNE